jgi:hypothetical protein
MKLTFNFLIPLIITSAVFYSCSREEITNTPIDTYAGVFVLYEGDFNTPGSGDYSFISSKNDSVSNNVYQNSNNGANLGLLPDGMIIYTNLELFVSSQGSYGSAGKMFRINSRTNKLTDTVTFGTNPYSLCYTTGRIYATNIAGNTVTKLDLDLNVLSTITVGNNPSEITTAGNYVYVSKASYTTQNTFSIIDIGNNSVTQIPFSSTPVSSAVINGKVYVSTYTNKVIYVMNYIDTLNPNIVNDSITLPPSVFTRDASTFIVAADFSTLYVVGADTGAWGFNIGKTVYKIDIPSKTVTQLIDLAGSDDIYGIDYDRDRKYLYIANSRGGLSNGNVLKYDSQGVLVKTYEIGGKFPRRFAFAY